MTPPTTPISHSIPHRPSGSKQTSSDHYADPPPSNQDTLKHAVIGELADGTWQLDSVILAHALSSKARKGDRPLIINELDAFQNYNVEIDKLDQVLEKCVDAFQHNHLPTDTNEKAHYAPLVSFLNACVNTCRKFYCKSFYNMLIFTVFDTQTQDGILGAFPLKPDIAGANGLSKNKKKLWWRPESGERSATTEIPVEVKSVWPELVAHAGTYARALMRARPLRQFSLVIGYNHTRHELRFLVFHAGGLTASPALHPNEIEGRRHILRLFLCLLTWETRGDAGLPEWTNDTEMFVQKDEGDQIGRRSSSTNTIMQDLGYVAVALKCQACIPVRINLSPGRHPLPLLL